MHTTNHANAKPAGALAAFAPYGMGVLTGAALALAAFTMMGQGYTRPNDGKPAGPAGSPPAAVAPVEVDEFFVTNGNAANTTARLWKRPAGKTNLEYIGEFQAAGRTAR
ncbi:MAG: hypothetical protein ACKVZJ_06915 [Phycisphaerales bacterium]